LIALPQVVARASLRRWTDDRRFQDTRVDMMLAWGVSFMIVMVLIDLLAFRLWARRVFAWRPQFAT
jgi:hypothetical protein